MKSESQEPGIFWFGPPIKHVCLSNQSNFSDACFISAAKVFLGLIVVAAETGFDFRCGEPGKLPTIIELMDLDLY